MPIVYYDADGFLPATSCDVSIAHWHPSKASLPLSLPGGFAMA
ncbi:hypothetical protein Pan181_48720 [Aeoliella mucimassa]|uniref:Uncharacterized protein n=1 Tax=Aeoliella mucimassa TaxID=2527972 RepID=A0A518AV95_9BACT|nr:hypothetical protein Pan181_48720 [Aeoliella mucimassa]